MAGDKRAAGSSRSGGGDERSTGANASAAPWVIPQNIFEYKVEDEEERDQRRFTDGCLNLFFYGGKIIKFGTFMHEIMASAFVSHL